MENKNLQDFGQENIGADSIFDAIFASDGLIKSFKEDYIPRESQIQAAKQIYNSLTDFKHIILEGPCGFGKTFAYLVPVMEYLHEHAGAKTVIVTNGISLQEQLIYKDIPFVNQIFKQKYSIGLKSAILKGKRNFLCRRKFELFLNGIYRRGYLDDLKNWGRSTKTGDFSELSRVLSEEEASLISIVSEDDCEQRGCPFFNECYYQNHKFKAAASDIIVTNYHFLFSDLKLGRGSLIPKYRVLILDEAHETASVYRDYFAEKYSPRGFSYVASRITKILSEADSGVTKPFLERFIKKSGDKYIYVELLQSFTKLFEESLGQCFERLSTNKADQFATVPTGEALTIPLYDDVLSALTDFQEQISGISINLASFIESALLEFPLEESPFAMEIKAGALVLKATDTLMNMIVGLKSAMKTLKSGDTDDKKVYYFEKSANGSVSLCCKNVYIGKDICENLFSDKDTSCVLTSATLSVDNQFDYIEDELGLNLLPQERVIDFTGASPFNLTDQQLWYLPADAVAGNDREFNASIEKNLCELVDASGGGILCLATSNYNLGFMYNILYRYCRNRGIHVLKQGDMPRQKLIEEFARDRNSILVATKSFFTGIDVPGDALRCVIIDKFPFASPNDPVVKARSSDKKAFFKYSVPDMVITLKQAVGRGVRTTSDRCVIAVLDGRMSTARYKTSVNNSFPYQKTGTRDIEEVRKFLKGE